MYLATAYETDNNNILTLSVAIHIGYKGEFQQSEIQSNLFVPEILLPNLQWFKRYPCSSKQLTPRSVILTLLSGDILEIAYPFRPGTANSITFWEQLQSPEIVSIKGIGEKNTDKFLRNSLGIL